jgi:hypothetical protein
MQLKLENDIHNPKNPPKSSQKHPGSRLKNTIHSKLTSQSITLIDILNPKPVDYSLPSSCISAFSTITFNLSSRLNNKKQYSQYHKSLTNPLNDPEIPQPFKNLFPHPQNTQEFRDK